MGKSGGFLTPKAIANRIKAKGLQKLRWYCQMCEKQCRDENGFKCHTMSESHQRQMAIFSDNPNKFLDEFSAEFEDSFIRHLRHRHGTKRVHANLVYAELIRDRNHLHMNATKWTSLTEFVKYLGRTGKATVDETPKGWFLAYIDRDPETLARQKALERRKKSDIDEEERERLRIEKQLEEARRQREALGLSADNDADGGHGEPGEKESADGSEADGGGVKLEGVKIAFSLGGPKKQPLTLGKTEEKAHHDDDEKGNTNQMDEAEADRAARKRKPNDDDEVDRAHGERDRDRDRERDRRGRDEEERDSKRARSSRWDKAASSSASTTSSSSSSTTTSSSSSTTDRRPQPSRPLTAVEEIMLQEEKRKQRERERVEKEKKEREMEMEMEKAKEKEKETTKKTTKAAATKTDYWLADGIVVKVKHKTVGGGKYYNQKGVIERVEGRYVGQIKMLQSGDVLRLDQDFLETVLPALEGRVLVLNGEHRGERATLKAIDVDKFCATIQLSSSGEVVKGIAYEDIAKLA